jgi:hypothetical protein
MKFLCLCCEEEAKLRGMSKQDWQALREETLAYVGRLEQDGKLLMGLPLKSVDTARTVAVRGGQTQITDGPFAETKEQIGGVLLIEVADMTQALEIARGWPAASIGRVEVRQIEDELPLNSRF